MHELRARLQGKAPAIIAEKPRARLSAENTIDTAMIRREERRLQDSRTGSRHRLASEQVELKTNRKSYSVALINLSDGGAMVEGEFMLTLFATVDLTLADNHQIACTVRWLKGNRAGLEFDAGTNLQMGNDDLNSLLRDVVARTFPSFDLSSFRGAPPPSPAASTDQRDPRRELVWSATLHYSIHTSAVRLRNMSRSGALVECSDDVSVGKECSLDLGRAGILDCKVVWQFGDQLGLKFDSEFDMSRMSRSMPQVTALKASAGQPQDPFVDLDQLSTPELEEFLAGFLKH